MTYFDGDVGTLQTLTDVFSLCSCWSVWFRTWENLESALFWDSALSARGISDSVYGHRIKYILFDHQDCVRVRFDDLEESSFSHL